MADKVTTKIAHGADTAEPARKVPPGKSRSADSEQVAILDAAFADPAMVALRAEKGDCATIRAGAAAHPTLPKNAFVAAGAKIGLHPSTVGIQRLKAISASAAR